MKRRKFSINQKKATVLTLEVLNNNSSEPEFLKEIFDGGESKSATGPIATRSSSRLKYRAKLTYWPNNVRTTISVPFSKNGTLIVQVPNFKSWPNSVPGH